MHYGEMENRELRFVTLKIYIGAITNKGKASNIKALDSF